MTTVIDTPAGIERLRMVSLIQALRIEARGMRVSSSVNAFKIAKSDYGIKAKSRAEAFEKAIALYEETYGEEYGGSRSI